MAVLETIVQLSQILSELFDIQLFQGRTRTKAYKKKKENKETDLCLVFSSGAGVVYWYIGVDSGDQLYNLLLMLLEL